MSSSSSGAEKEEQSAQEYLDKIGDVFHFDCYHEKKPESCHQYGEYLIVAKREPIRAYEVFSSCCNEMKFSESCLALGNMYLTGKGPPNKDIQTALKYFEKACQLGSMGGCSNAGLVYQNGYQDTRPDYERAIKYFQQSCHGGFKNGCFNLSILYLQGKKDEGKGEGGVRQDMNKALEYSLESCDLGHPWGCANASRILRLGDGGVERDVKRGEELMKRAKKLSRNN